MNISVLGCGRWGSFIAWYLDKTGHKVISWGLSDAPDFLELKTTRKNSNLRFSDSVTVTDDLTLAVTNSDVLIISISSQHLRSFMGRVTQLDINGKTIVLCMKGIEEDTGCRLSEVVSSFVSPKVNIAVWVGPGHVQDFVRGIPNCMVIDSESKETKSMLVHSFSSELIRFYFGTDLIGSEVGAASKNVIGIAAGMLDGLNCTSLKGALMSRGTREIARLISAMGGNEVSAYGLCHLGDYEATLFSKYSHNRRFGEVFVKGESFDKLAEGVSTTKALVTLSKKYSVDMPIVTTVNDVLFNKVEPKEALSSLFIRSIKDEF